jgi:hypothetical protein
MNADLTVIGRLALLDDVVGELAPTPNDVKTN